MSQLSSSLPFPRIAGTILCALFLVGTVIAAPRSVRCGTLSTIEIESGSVRTVDLEKALAAGKVTPQSNSPSELTEGLEPTSRREFVILTFDLNRGMSLGKTDYRLRLDGRLFPCLGLALGTNNPFDPRRLDIVTKDERQTVRALFEIPEGAEKATLVFSLPTTMPVEDIPLVLRESSPTPQPDEQATPSAENTKEKPEPTSRKTGEKGEDAKEETPKTEPKPAPESKPKPEKKKSSDDPFDML